MSTTAWFLGLIESLISCWLLWPLLIFVVWLWFAVRIGKRHYLILDDLLPEEEQQA